MKIDNLISILVTVLVFGVLIFIHEFGHFITARICGVGVREFAVGMGPQLFSWRSKKYGTKYGVRALPIGGYVSMVGEDEASDDESAFCNKALWKRALIIVAGPVMNVVLCFLLMTTIVLSQSALASTVIGSFDKNAVSSEKLMVGDRIISVDGTLVFTGNEAAYEIMNKGYEPIDIKVERDGKVIVVEDVNFGHFLDSGATFGEMDMFFFGEEKTLLNLLKHSFFRSVSTVKMTVDSIVSLIVGRFGLDSVSGPVGVAGAVGDAVKMGWVNIVYLVALLSANLGVFNLIPFPALDGGRLLMLAIELFRGKPMKKETEAYINFAGLAVLLAIMVIVMGKDIIKLIGG